MMTYICNPLFPVTSKDAGLDIAQEGKDAAAKEAWQETEENAGAEVLAEQARDQMSQIGRPGVLRRENARKNSKSDAISLEDQTTLGKIMRKVGKFMGRLWDKVKKTFKLMINILYTVLRCGVCVVCNIVHEIVQFFKSFVKRLKDMGPSIVHGLTSMKNATGHFFSATKDRVREIFGKGLAKNGETFLDGEKCGTSADCKKGSHCSAKKGSASKFYKVRCVVALEKEKGERVVW
jgi:hypothetical protein